MTPEDKAPDMPCCAHLRVTERHEENGGFVTRTWWECELCRLEFTPLPPQSPDQGAVELIKRLRDTPNWLKTDFGNWKDSVSRHDRAPFEAADYIEQALTRPPLDLAGLKVEIVEAMDNGPEYYCNSSAVSAVLDHLQAIRPDLFGGKKI